MTEPIVKEDLTTVINDENKDPAIVDKDKEADIIDKDPADITDENKEIKDPADITDENKEIKDSADIDKDNKDKDTFIDLNINDIYEIEDKYGRDLSVEIINMAKEKNISIENAKIIFDKIIERTKGTQDNTNINTNKIVEEKNEEPTTFKSMANDMANQLKQSQTK